MRRNSWTGYATSPRLSRYSRGLSEPREGELKPFFKRTGTGIKRDAQKYHDKLMVERWEQDKLGVKPHYTWDEAAAKFLEETSHKRTHEWDKSMLRWFLPLLGGKT